MSHGSFSGSLRFCYTHLTHLLLIHVPNPQNHSINQHSARTFLRIATLLSHLVKDSSHFVTTYQTLRCDAGAPPHWGSDNNKEPLGPLDAFLRVSLSAC
jgi:hypothetical protein